MIERILIAIDTSEPAARALEAASELAAQVHAEVAIVHVVDLGPASVPEFGVIDKAQLAEVQREGVELLRHARLSITRTVEAETFLLHGDAAETIITAAREWKADLVVMGADSRGRLAHFLLGSTADAVIRRAPCPVLTVRQQHAIARESDNLAAHAIAG